CAGRRNGQRRRAGGCGVAGEEDYWRTASGEVVSRVWRGREFMVCDGVDDEGADGFGCGGACGQGLAMDVSAIIGEELKAVEFVEDFLQLRFDAPLFRLYSWPHVLLTDFSVAFGEPEYRNALCA